MNNIVLIGAPGSGKGTQGDLIKDKFNLWKFSSGDALREIIKTEGSLISGLFADTIAKGQLISDEIMNDVTVYTIFKKFLLSKDKYNGILFDGYPRKVSQAEFMDVLLERYLGQPVKKAILFDVDLEKLVERIVHRFTCAKCGEGYNYKTKPTKVDGVCDKCGSTEFAQRKDDNEESVRVRFGEYESMTAPVVDFYKNKGVLEVVNADDAIENITKKVESILSC